MGLRGDDWRKLFARRYRLALIVVACVWSFASFLQYNLVANERYRGEVIAMAAEQGALSQRIAFLSHHLDPNAARCLDPTVCADLLAATDRMELNHAVLTGAKEREGFSRFLEPIAPIYAAGRMPFGEAVTAFIDAACKLVKGGGAADGLDRAALIRQIETSGTNSIHQTHALIVEVLEAEARRAMQLAALTTAVSWGAMLALLGLISLKIFRPMATHLQTAFNQMEAAQIEALSAARQAARANQARGEFLKTASHELKTPLNAIMGLAEVIREGKDGADRLLIEMSHASDHLLSMLNTMLDTHRLDEGRLEISSASTALAPELRSAAEIAADLARRKGLCFEASIDVADDVVVDIDAKRLRQVCLNLLDNAVRFTGQGSVVFTARLRKSEDKELLEIGIEDTGVGISRRRLNRIFDRYSSDHGSHSRTLDGIGLGLSLTKTIIDMMGGTIRLDSAVGKGTHVSFSVPAVRTQCLGEERNIPRGEKANRILIVDDQHPNRLVAEAMVSLIGAKPVLAENGREALDLAMTEAFDLILMDVAMPVMDGMEAVEALRSRPGPNRATPVIAVTAHVAAEDEGELLARGFQAVVHKPVRKAVLDRAMARYISFTGSEEMEAAS